VVADLGADLREKKRLPESEERGGKGTVITEFTTTEFTTRAALDFQNLFF
jgi:hypothetical protein